MRVWRYSRWDGSQAEFRLDAERALKAVSDFLMEGLDLNQALEWMRQLGFELAGQEFRVMGVEELLEELAREEKALRERYRLDSATRELERRLESILRREEAAQRERFGLESARLNEFLNRRHSETGSLSERIERFRDHEFADEEAGEEYQQLLAELERLKALEKFLRERGAQFRGSQAADYETAQQIRERLEALERLRERLASGQFESLSLDELRELLSENAVRSIVLLRDL
ncbi:MAG TPA: hypothetical protein VEG67_04690, partial [Myxococcota bacterium]|nr:hypothetical protein [Myxococcota bacterium]